MNEAQLLNYLKEKHLPDLVKEKDTYSRWDCYSNQKKVLIELKCRRKHYDTLLIEKKKYTALVERAKELGYTPWYINSTPKGIYGWNLDKQEIEWSTENKHPATTDFNNRFRVSKVVGYLCIKQAKILKGELE